MIAPKAFAEGGFNILLRQGKHTAEELLFIHFQHRMMIGDVVDQPARRKLC
ncbi:hypothetical protein D3C85_1536210 [compost metagenome]